MLEKTVKIGDKEVRFKSSAAVPRMYRIKFNQDIFVDMGELEEAYKKNLPHKEASTLGIAHLTIFENVAYIMALHADPTIPDNIDEWLEGFEMFSIYEILPAIMELWGSNVVSIAEAKKNTTPQNEK